MSLLRRQLHLLLYVTLPGLLLLYFRRRLKGLREAPIPDVPFSQFLSDATSGRLAEVWVGPGHFNVALKSPPSRLLSIQATGPSGVWGPGGEVAGSLATGTAKTVYRTRPVALFDRKGLVELLTKHGVVFGAQRAHWSKHLATALVAVAPMLYVAMVARLLTKLRTPFDKDSVGKSVDHDTVRSVSFADVAGVDEAQAELAEIVDFLRDGQRYLDMGARLPRGVLLSGPSGTGKTLLARAVASEAGVPFISCSASDFVELLVGRGAARMRDLFQRGAAAAPCIIFIDELDALAKARGGFNSNDEREQTLNQLLTEMDGFDSEGNGVVVIAATNRPEVLDPALTRPGRFDRHVSVGLPDRQGRASILQVHARKIRLRPGVSLSEVAEQTEGFSGAELANVVNEAALLAVRTSQQMVDASHLREAVRRALRFRELYQVDFQAAALQLLS